MRLYMEKVVQQQEKQLVNERREMYTSTTSKCSDHRQRITRV